MRRRTLTNFGRPCHPPFGHRLLTSPEVDRSTLLPYKKRTAKTRRRKDSQRQHITENPLLTLWVKRSFMDILCVTQRLCAFAV